ncbi:MAG: zinc ribbon domain-containing protein [Chitinivibrionia bacterium]|nr:zinc ribbon domain-containing protein [Chitinivibrionia bacterium]
MYEYKCSKCEIVFSELRKITERNDPIACPHCGGEASAILSMFAQGKGALPSCGNPAGPGPSCPTGFS